MPSQALNGFFMRLTIMLWLFKKDNHPSKYEEFCKENFSVNKLKQPFSRLPLDESYQRNNACVKVDGGAVVLTRNSKALLWCMLSCLEMARVVRKFLGALDLTKSTADPHHDKGNNDFFGVRIDILISYWFFLNNKFRNINTCSIS